MLQINYFLHSLNPVVHAQKSPSFNNVCRVGGEIGSEESKHFLLYSGHFEGGGGGGSGGGRYLAGVGPSPQVPRQIDTFNSFTPLSSF